MDKETDKTTKPQAASRSSDALTTTNTPRAASSDAPSIPNIRAASRDAPKRQMPKTAPKKQKRLAASKDAMRKETAKDAPQQAASRAIPTSSASMDAPPSTTLTERPRTPLAHGDSRSTAKVDAPKTRAASTAAVSERDLTSLAKAPQAGASNDDWQTVANKKTSLKAVSATAEKPKGEVATGVAKRKRSERPRGRKNPNKTNPEQPARAQKRSRPEDSVTPTGISKKSKPARSRMVDGTLVSYAEAAASFRSNELCVAVMTEPFLEMTQEQAEGIRQVIENQLRALLKAPEPTDTNENTAIHFRGRAHFAEGVLKTWCEDDFTMAWLKGVINNIPSPLPGTKLTVRPQADIPKKVMCMLFVPENTEDTTELLRMLARQNPNLKINSWTLTHERARQEPPGTCLFFRVPEPMVKTIKDQQRRVYYLMGSIYIRFLEEGGTREDAAAPTLGAASGAPEREPGSPLPERSPSPPAMETVGEAVDLATSMAALEVLSTAGSTRDPPSSGLISDEECFPPGESSEGEDSSLCSSPLRD